MKGPVPVTLLSGFLGAGKTTLLNRILEDSSGKRMAVIENEFGSLNIDCVLVEGASSALFALQDGCLCCSVFDELVGVLGEIAKGEIDHLVIEATGLADPAPVMAALSAPGLEGAFVLAGVVTLVDAANIGRDLDETDVCARQIALADVLILNKVSQVPSAAVPALEDRLRALNPFATIHTTDHACVDVSDVLADHRSEMPPRMLSVHHDHDDAIRPVALEVEAQLDIQAVDVWLGSVVRTRDILRMKGVLAVPGDDRRFVFQGVRQWVDVHPHTPWGDAPRINQLVFIGRDLDAPALQAGLDACVEVWCSNG